MLISTFHLLGHAADPPVFDAALFNCLFLIFLAVADNRHAVVNLHRTFGAVLVCIVAALLQGAARIEPELLGGGVECDRDRLLHDLRLHLFNIAISGGAPLQRPSYRFGIIVGTFFILSLVGVVFIGHDAVIFHESPMDRHPAAIAATHSIGLPKLFHVIVSVAQAIHSLLLGETLRDDSSVHADGALEGRRCCESPAGTTITLVLDFSHEWGVVDSGGQGDALHTWLVVT